MSDLVLECVLAVSADGILQSDLVSIELRNDGNSPVVVAGRLAVGYETSTDRELYLVITRRGTDEVVGRRTQLYHRAPHPPDDIASLAPGDSRTTQFSVREWYEFPDGELDIEAVYDPREAAATFPDVAAELVRSDPVPVVVERRR